jgi:transposase
MEKVHVLRHKVRVEGVSVREAARDLGISRNTARRYLEGAEAGHRRVPDRPQPVRALVGKRVTEILADSANWTQGKQRLTAPRMQELLRAEKIEAGLTLLKELMSEHRRARQEVFIPLVYKPGDLAEVDFFEVYVDIGSERRKAWMFVMRLMHSGRDFAWLYPRQDQVCFLDGHVRAFTHFGAVPQRIVYDNLKAAVSRILAGSARELSARFLSLATHYAFETSFARPRTGHDKGGVESRGRSIRWQHLVPIPKGDSLSAINASLIDSIDERMVRDRNPEGRTIAERFPIELERMVPLPRHTFRAASTHLPEVSRRALVKLEGGFYSVPCRWAGLSVTAYVGVDAVEIVSSDGSRIHHPRAAFGHKSIDYRHYVPELAKKPQAVRQVIEELLRDLGAPFDRLWRNLVDQHGPREAARVFARVLAALETLGYANTIVCIERSFREDEPVLIALRASSASAKTCSVPSHLGGIEVESGSASDYDELLGGDR